MHPIATDKRTKARDIVIETLEDSLALDKADIKMQSKLCADLDMESIDELDIQFEIEAATGREAQDLFGQGLPLAAERYKMAYSPESMEVIRTKMSHFYNAMSPEERKVFELERIPTQFRKSWNVAGLVNYVERII